MLQIRNFFSYVRRNSVELGLSTLISIAGLVAAIASVTTLGTVPLLAYCLQFVAGWCLLAISIWGLSKLLEYSIELGVVAFLRSHLKR